MVKAAFLVIALGFLGSAFTGCFATRPTTLESLRQSDRPVVVRIQKTGGEVIRGIVSPGDLGPASIRYRPLRYGPSSWVVRFAGWPAVYTSGKILRYEAEGESVEIPAEEVAKIDREEYRWFRTVLSFPLTLPPGIIDFLIHHVRFGFDAVDIREDSFSRPPSVRP